MIVLHDPVPPLTPAGCGHPDPDPYTVCPWTGKPRLYSLCRDCHEQAVRRHLREALGVGLSAGLDGDRRRAGKHVSNAA